MSYLALLFIRQGQAEKENAAHIGRRIEAHFTSHEFHPLFRQCQAQASAGVWGANVILALPEPLENGAVLVQGNPHACILHRKNQTVKRRPVFNHHFHLAALAAEFDGIVPIERPPKGRLRYWLGKIIQFPIGERWLVISASAVIGGAALHHFVNPASVLAKCIDLVKYNGKVIFFEPMEIGLSIFAICSAFSIESIKFIFSNNFIYFLCPF